MKPESWQEWACVGLIVASLVTGAVLELVPAKGNNIKPSAVGVLP